MGFQGSLDTVGLADIFQLFGFGRKSGALHLRHGSEHGVIHFDQGDVFYATMSPGEVVGNLLVRAELVSAEQWKQVLADTGGDRLQGEVVTRLDGIDTVAIEVFLRERVEDAVFRLAQWDGGEFDLVDDAHPFGPVFRFETEELLATAERRMGEWRRITDVVPSVAMGVTAVSDLPAERTEVTLTRDEWRLLTRVTPGCNIAEVAAGLGETEFRTCRTLAAMVEAGIVELSAPSAVFAEPDPEPASQPAPASAPAHVLAPPGAPGRDLVADPVEEWPPPAPVHGDPVPKLSLAELAAAAEEVPPPSPPPSPPQHAAEAHAAARVAAPVLPEETEDHLAADVVADYPHHQDHVPQPVVRPYLETVTPPPVVYSSFDQGGPDLQQPVPAPLPYADMPVAPAPGNGTATGEVPVVAPLGDYGAAAPAEFGAETPIANADAVLAEAAAGDSDLDKSLILRLIAGVKSL